MAKGTGKPDHRNTALLPNVALCGVKWAPGVSFGSWRSGCAECERRMGERIDRHVADGPARRARALARSKAYDRF